MSNASFAVSALSNRMFQRIEFCPALRCESQVGASRAPGAGRSCLSGPKGAMVKTPDQGITCLFLEIWAPFLGCPHNDKSPSTLGRTQLLGAPITGLHKFLYEGLSGFT